MLRFTSPRHARSCAIRADQPDALILQPAKAPGQIRDLEIELRERQARLNESSRVIADRAGRVLELLVDRGAVIGPGTALLNLELVSEDLMAVVEPLLPSVSPEEIRAEIATARLAAEEGPAGDGGFDDYDDVLDSDLLVPEGEDPGEPRPAPSPVEVRAGFARIAALLTGRS